MKKTNRKIAKVPAPESPAMTDQDIAIIAEDFSASTCDMIVKRCKLESDEVRLRDAIIRQLQVNSNWSFPDLAGQLQNLFQSSEVRNSDGLQDAIEDLINKVEEANSEPTFFLQTKAPAGNWVDSLGSSDLESCKRHGRYLQKEQKEEVRVVQRFDKVV